MNPTRWLVLSVLTCQAIATAPTAEAQGPGKSLAFNRVRFYPAPGHEGAMVGGRFAGSNVSPISGYEVLAEIKDAPTAGEWTELTFPNGKVYRWLRYEGPGRHHGNVAELEFFAGDRKLNGPGFGSIGDRGGRAWRMAINGKVATWFDSDTPDGAFVGIDLRDQVTAKTPILKARAGRTLTAPGDCSFDPDAGGLDPIYARWHQSRPRRRVALRPSQSGSIGGRPCRPSRSRMASPEPPVFGTYLVGRRTGRA